MVTVRRSPELEELARESQRRYYAGDDAWFDARRGDGEVLMCGTAPGEEWRGAGAVRALTIQQMRTMNKDAGMVESNEDPDRIEGYEAGDAGWVVVHARSRLSDGSSVPIRAITVFGRDEDGWKSCLFASQVLVPNELAGPGTQLAAQLSQA